MIKKKDLTTLEEDDSVEAPDVTLMVVPGHVAECTLMQSMVINKVKMELKGVKDGIEVMAFSRNYESKRGIWIQQYTG